MISRKRKRNNAKNVSCGRTYIFPEAEKQNGEQIE